MDNQTIDVTSEGDGGIASALTIIWDAAAPGGKATHYKVIKLAETTTYYGTKSDKWPDNITGISGIHAHHFTKHVADDNGIETLILLWHDERDSIALPFPLDKSQAANFIVNWLKQVTRGKQPDHDGDNRKGWRLFTEDWGHVAGHHYAIVAVQPAWAMYGK